MQKQVKKRDGSIEPYEEDKIAHVVKAAGLSGDLARALSVKVTAWINSLSEPSISSLVIRDKVLELLTSTDKNVANFYRWYQKTKE
jgi:transcriptional regulator NrdR family protein